METTTTQTTTATAPELSIRPYYKKDLLVEYNTGEQHFLLWGEYNLEVTYNADGYPADSPNWDTDNIATWRNYYTLVWGDTTLVSCDGQDWETLEYSENGREVAELATIEIL